VWDVAVAGFIGELMSDRRVLFVGKFPPWQGGTSVHGWEAACAFAKEGYKIHVITLRPQFNSGLGTKFNEEDINTVNGIANLTVTYIPVGEQSVATLIGDAAFSLLFGEIIRVLKHDHFDLAIGWYFEPFGMATAIACTYKNVPFFLRHAGSDLFRLTESEQLAAAFSQAFATCETLFTNNNNKHLELISRIDLPTNKIIHLKGNKLPDYWQDIKQVNNESLASNTKITFMIYGKISPYKGVVELLEVINKLESIGEDTQLLYLAAGSPESVKNIEKFLKSKLNNPLRIDVQSAVAPWQVPKVVQNTDFICILENNFPILIHSPIVLREALASGKVLIVSREIVERSAFGKCLIDEKNCLIIDDVHDSEKFLQKIIKAVKNRETRTSFAYLSKKLSEFIEDSFVCRHPMVEAVETCLGWKTLQRELETVQEDPRALIS
jgi:glycosyltransferase involved in cell wall biosynthesis